MHFHFLKGGCRTGMAKVTNAYDLPARWVCSWCFDLRLKTYTFFHKNWSSLTLIFLPLQVNLYHVLSGRSYILLVQNMLSNTILLQRMLWAIATVLALNFSLKMGFRGCESCWCYILFSPYYLLISCMCWYF